MGQQQQIQGLFSGGAEAHPRASGEESGLRPRPRPRRESLPDLSDQAVELPDEDDFLEDVRPSDTIPPGRVRAADVAALAEARAPRSEPPPLPVPLERRAAPALPLPLTRKSAPSLEELGAHVRPKPYREPEDERIDLDEVARLATSAAPPPVFDDEIPHVPGPAPLAKELSRRTRRRALSRAVGLVAAALALVGAGWAVAQLGTPETDRDVSAETRVTTAAPAPVEATPVLAAPADVEELVEAAEPVRLDEVVVSAPVRQESSQPAAVEREARGVQARIEADAPVAVVAPVDEMPADDELAVEEAGEPAEPERAADAEAEAAAAEAEAARLAALPETPSREQVLEAVQGVEARVRECAEGHYGVVPVQITVASSGRVTTAVVTGGTVRGTPAGSCIARSVRQARFPEFRQDRFVVEYPFQL